MSAPILTRTPPDVSRVLLLHPGALGDLVQALPAFGAVRAGFAHARVTLLTDAPLAGLARTTRLFDEVLAFDAAVAYRGGAAARLRLLAELAATARRVRPDAAAVFKGAPVYAALALASGARRRAGLARGAGRALLTHPVAIAPARHHEDRYLDVAAALGADPSRRAEAAWPATPSPVPAALRARAWPLVGVAPGGARNAKQDTPTKRWPAARFAALARELAAAHPEAAFVLLGGDGDRAEVEVVRAALPADRVVDLAGRTDLLAARAAVAALDVYVGNDSGLMHVAATTSTPAVVPFGPTDPRVIAPRAPGVRAVWDPGPDPPCYDEVTGAHRPCRTPCCIDRVDVGRVRAAVDAAIAAARPAARPAGRPAGRPA
jgi:ADP-heptose:LPS heptosyltransferase